MSGGGIRLTMPVVAAGGARIVQLVVLLVLTRTTEADTQATLVAGFGILSAFAMLTDSGASGYLLSTPAEALRRDTHAHATGFHLLLGTAGAAGALVVVSISPGARPGPEVWAVLVALAVAQVCDSMTRMARAPLLVANDDAGYAVPEVVLALSKAPILVAAFVVGSPLPLVLLVLPSLAVAAWTFAVTSRALVGGSGLPPRFYRSIAEFGVSGSVSSITSQAPLVIGSVGLGVVAIAPLAAAYRIVQPLEFVPATVSQQLVPRFRAERQPVARWLAAFAGIAAIAVAALLLLFAPLDALFGGVLVFALFGAVAASMVPKFANYALVAFAMGRGFIRQRLVATIAVAVFAVGAAAVAVGLASTDLLAWVGIACETLLLVLLGALLFTRLRRGDAA